jgi:hypothetical protein
MIVRQSLKLAFDKFVFCSDAIFTPTLPQGKEENKS